MGKKKKYFFIARNKNNNDYKIIKIDGKRSHSLEEIDEFTIKFCSGDNMADYLSKAKVIDCANCDFYIASQTDKRMNYLEVVYSFFEKRAKLLNSVIDSSKNKTLTTINESAKKILNEFAEKMNHDDDFYEYVISGYSRIPKSFIKWFVDNKSVNYNAKYINGAWPIKTYSLLRNVIVEMNRYDANRIEVEYTDIRSKNNEVERRKLDDLLLIETSDDYVEGQLDFTNLLKDEEKEEEKEEEKIVEILEVFSNIPVNVIARNSKGQLCFRSKLIPSYEYAGNDKEKLQTLLSKEIAEIVYELVNVRQNTSIFDDGNFEESMDRVKIKLVEKLKENKQVLDNAYQWCLVYNKYSERLKGDLYGRQYTRHESN